jgi:signal peptidase II
MPRPCVDTTHALGNRPEHGALVAVNARCAAIGGIVAVLSLGFDQAHKWWMLHVFDISARKPVTVTPFLDLVLVWNTGISYGLFPQDTRVGRLAIMAVALAIVAIMIVWLLRTADRLVAVAIGLVIGGALGNAIDRQLYGAVADFFRLHAFGYQWYVFNLADVAIVAGVALLLYDSFNGKGKLAGK